MTQIARIARILRSFVLIALFAVAGSAHAVDAGTPLDRFFDGLRTLSARFEQTIFDADGRATQSASGRLSIERPGKFRWDYQQPYEQVILGDGERLWTYDADLEQATVKPQSDALAGTPALLLSANEQPDDLFDVAPLPSRDGEHWFELTPKSGEDLGDTQFNRLRLGFSGDLLIAMELVDGFDQTTQIRFSDLERNITLEPGLFHFDPPQGVDVIGGNGP